MQNQHPAFGRPPPVPYQPTQSQQIPPPVLYQPTQSQQIPPPVLYQPTQSQQIPPPVPYQPTQSQQIPPPVLYQPTQSQQIPPPVPYQPTQSQQIPPPVLYQPTQSQQIPTPPGTGQYMSIPMPPPVNPLLVSQQIQSQIQSQGQSIPEQQPNTSYISQNQTSYINYPYGQQQTKEYEQTQNQAGYNSGASGNQFNQNYSQPLFSSTPIFSTQNIQQQHNVQDSQQQSLIIFKTQEYQNNQSSQILENSRIITNSQIKEMNISSNTHNMIQIEQNSNEFSIQPFDEKLKKEKNKNKQLVNSNIFIIQNKDPKIPDIEFEIRYCSEHNKPNDKICADQYCKDNNEILLCQDCTREHKGHNLFDIQEALFLIQKNQVNLDKNIQLIESIKIKTFQQFKLLKSNITWQLKEIEDQLEEGFENFKQSIQQKKTTFQEAYIGIQSGGLSKMIEKANYIFDQGLFLEVNQNSNESQYKQLSTQLEKVLQSMFKFEQLIEDEKKANISIKLNNVDLFIDSQKIQTFNDLYYQIKVDALKQKFTNFFDEELLLLQNNTKAIKLKGNMQEINIKEQWNMQIVSYQEI